MTMLPFEVASVVLANVIRAQYAELSRLTGKRYTLVAAEVAPSTLDEVVNVWGVCGGSFPISCEGLSGSIYGVDEINAQFRFVHDSLHARYGFGFDTDGELGAAAEHVRMTYKSLMSAGTLTHGEVVSVCFLLWLDTAGQALYYRDNAGGFLLNQREAVRDWYNDTPTLSRELVDPFVKLIA